MRNVSWRAVWLGISAGGLIGVLIGVADLLCVMIGVDAPELSFLGLGLLYGAGLIMFVAVLLMFFHRLRAAGAVLLLASCAMVASLELVSVLRRS
jgi:hypothetical protein